MVLWGVMVWRGKDGMYAADVYKRQTACVKSDSRQTVTEQCATKRWIGGSRYHTHVNRAQEGGGVWWRNE